MFIIGLHPGLLWHYRCLLAGADTLAEQLSTVWVPDIVQLRHHLDEVVAYLFVDHGVSVVGGVIKDEVPNKGRTRLYLPSCSLAEEAQICIDFLDFVFGPLPYSHVLLAQLEETPVVTDALIAVQDLPNVELSIA